MQGRKTEPLMKYEYIMLVVVYEQDVIFKPLQTLTSQFKRVKTVCVHILITHTHTYKSYKLVRKWNSFSIIKKKIESCQQ